MADYELRVRSWVRGSEQDIRCGLLGFLSFFVGDLIVDNVTLRRTQTGRYALSWPSRVDKRGNKHSSVKPANDEVRRRIEAQVFAELAEREELPALEGDADG